MKKYLKVLMAAALLTAALVFTGCNLNLNLDGLNIGDLFDNNSDSGGHDITPGSTSIVTSAESFSGEKISKVKVEWVTGSIDVSCGDAVSYEADESPDQPEERKVAFELEGDTLIIKEYGESRLFSLNISQNKLKDYESKALRLTVPAGLSELEIETVSADIRMDGVSVEKLEIESVSANINADGMCAGKIEVETVSGSMELTLREAADEISIEAVSGNVTLYLAESIGFTAETQTVSGKINCDIDAKQQNGKTVHGDGAMIITMSAISGNLNIFELK